jgi:hypothetical protein
VNRQQHKKHWRSFAGFTGGQFMVSCSDGELGPEEAKDITQGFFADLLEHKSLTAIRKEKGRFRSFLLGALKHFLADEKASLTASATKR